ncbi:MAG: hypothetical protein ACI38Y_03880 [Candidatus Methanomethylophilaceae archaeon]
MDRMGKITLFVLAVAVLLTPVCLSDYSDATEGGTGVETTSSPVDVSDELGACEVSMLTANTEESVLNWVKETWLKGISWGSISGLDLASDYYTNLTVTKTADATFKAAVAGTPSDKDGTEGELSFDITDSDGKIKATIVCKITTVFDPKSVTCQVLMEDFNTQAQVITWLNSTWIPNYKTITGEPATTELSVVITKDTTFKAAVAGTKDSKTGVNGSLTFDIVKTVGTTDTTIATGLTCTVKAYDYGDTASTDKSVVFEGGKINGLTINVKDHVLTDADLVKILNALGGTDLLAAVGVKSSSVTTYTNALVIKDGDKEIKYVSGDIVKIDGKQYILQVGDREIALYELNTSSWVKYDRTTFEQTYQDDGQYQCEANVFPLNLNGSSYLVRYSVMDRSSAVDTGNSYICFLYTMDGKSAGYVRFSGDDAMDIGSGAVFTMNEGMTPSEVKSAPITAIYLDKDGYPTILRTNFSKEVSIARDGKAYDTTGIFKISLGNMSGAVKFYEIGTEVCTEYLVTVPSELAYETSCPSTKSPLVAVTYSEMGADAQVKDLVFPGAEEDDGGRNSLLYVAVAVVAILAVGAIVYYVRFMKP